MVKMLRKDQVERLSPESRIKNSYESLYYRAGSGDPETDEIVKGAIQQSFRRHGVTLNDHPDDAVLRNVMLDAYKESTKELGGENLSSSREQNLTRDFDRFTKNHPSFYMLSFESYENRYKGEPVDFFADYDRLIQENDGVDPFVVEPTEADLEAMQRDRLKKFSQEGEMRAVGLSYTGYAPGVRTQPRRSYQQIKQEEAAAQEMKGDKYDKRYDYYTRGRGDTNQKMTAGDDYGFDEREYDLEDDGPEL
jgi:hypothetical protein